MFLVLPISALHDVVYYLIVLNSLNKLAIEINSLKSSSA